MLTAGPQGPQGPQGAKGEPGTGGTVIVPRDFTVEIAGKSYFLRDASASSALTVVVHIDPAEFPAGTSHLGLNIAGVNAEARIQTSSTEHAYAFSISATNVQTLSRLSRDTLTVTLSYYASLTGGRAFAEDKELIFSRSTAPPAPSGGGLDFQPVFPQAVGRPEGATFINNQDPAAADSVPTQDRFMYAGYEELVSGRPVWRRVIIPTGAKYLYLTSAGSFGSFGFIVIEDLVVKAYGDGDADETPGILYNIGTEDRSHTNIAIHPAITTNRELLLAHSVDGASQAAKWLRFKIRAA